jgi:predicted RNA polymerase sigma factor
MQQLILQIKESSKDETVTIEELYDRYAAAVYGRIIRIVKQKDVAEKILERVFITALEEKKIKAIYLKPLTNLINHTHKKTYNTLKAIKIFQACACGYEGANPLILDQNNFAENPA